MITFRAGRFEKCHTAPSVNWVFTPAITLNSAWLFEGVSLKWLPIEKQSCGVLILVTFIHTFSPLMFMPTFNAKTKKVAHTKLVGILEELFPETEMSLRSS